MQNPFHRLKHYRPDENDSKENHATEVLAACLVFSEAFRKRFLEFLFPGKVPKALQDAAQVEVKTQYSTGGSGTIDLLLHRDELQRDRSGVVVEVKVGAKEDKTQLDKYQIWLDREYAMSNALFTLVRSPDPLFEHRKALRREWSDLFKTIEKFIEDCDDPTDKTLLKSLCEYLTMEGVVDNMDYSKLVDYGKGWAAEKALEGLFARTTEFVRLKDPDLLEPRNYERKDWSPSFQFGRKSWKSLFGNKGWNNKVYVWFCTPVTEGADCKECDFRFETWLWHKDHAHDWDYTAKRLPAWFKHFDKNDCKRVSYSKRGQREDWNIKQPLNQDSIYCVELGSPIRVDEDKLKNIDGLARELADRVVECLRLVDELRSEP